MRVLIPILITVVAAALFVPSFLSYLRNEKARASCRLPTKDWFFCGRDKGFYWVYVGVAASAVLASWVYFFAANFPTSADIFFYSVFSFLILVLLYCGYAATRGTIAVHGDSLIHTPLFAKTRRYSFSDITRAKHVRDVWVFHKIGGITVYAGQKKLFYVPTRYYVSRVGTEPYPNFDRFYDKLVRHNIPIEKMGFN